MILACRLSLVSRSVSHIPCTPPPLSLAPFLLSTLINPRLHFSPPLVPRPSSPTSLPPQSCKAFGIALKLTFEGPDNQMLSLHTWTFATILVVSACVQIMFLNKALATFSSNRVAGIYFFMSTTFVMLGSGLLFHEWQAIDGKSVVCILSGFLTLSTGVYILKLTDGVDTAFSNAAAFEEFEYITTAALESAAMEVLDQPHRDSTLGGWCRSLGGGSHHRVGLGAGGFGSGIGGDVLSGAAGPIGSAVGVISANVEAARDVRRGGHHAQEHHGQQQQQQQKQRQQQQQQQQQHNQQHNQQQQPPPPPLPPPKHGARESSFHTENVQASPSMPPLPHPPSGRRGGEAEDEGGRGDEHGGDRGSTRIDVGSEGGVVETEAGRSTPSPSGIGEEDSEQDSSFGCSTIEAGLPWSAIGAGTRAAIGAGAVGTT